jgi:CheY-like chemotaxis protein
MEAVGTLAGGVAHDFNNVLSAIVGYASLLDVKIAKDDPRHLFVENILASTERAASLTKSLLSFSRKQAVELKPVSLNEIVTAFQRILARLIGEDIAFSITCFPDDLVVEADQGQIEQVLMNLVTNARDAMPQGGRLQISTERAVFDRDSGEIARGTYAVIVVSDSGRGMDKAIQEHIFEPFFTTKGVGKGTGLGLAIVYGIVKKHGGAIHLYSEPGIGTTFKVFLPISQAPIGQALRPAAPLALQSGSGTILVIEDDVQTKEVARVLLEECGYVVLTAADGAEGLRVFREHGDRIQLVLTDLIMPNMSGREVYEAIERVRPGIKAVFMSGYSMELIEEKGLLEHGMHFLSKPLNPTELLAMIRAVLAQ